MQREHVTRESKSIFRGSDYAFEIFFADYLSVTATTDYDHARCHYAFHIHRVESNDHIATKTFSRNSRHIHSVLESAHDRFLDFNRVHNYAFGNSSRSCLTQANDTNRFRITRVILCYNNRGICRSNTQTCQKVIRSPRHLC